MHKNQTQSLSHKHKLYLIENQEQKYLLAIASHHRKPPSPSQIRDRQMKTLGQVKNDEITLRGGETKTKSLTVCTHSGAAVSANYGVRSGVE